MANLITQPVGEASNSAPNLDLLPAGAFERNDPLELTAQALRGIHRLTATYGATGEPTPGADMELPPEPALPPHALDDKYGIDGPTPGLSLHFTAPLPESVAQDMHQAKQGEIARANAAARTPAGLGTVLGDLGVGFLDPLGLAAGMLPVVGEARIAGLLGRAGISLGDGLLARSVLRGAAGAVSGAGAMVPLEGLHMALGSQEQQDVSMWDAARQVAFGALLGGVLHPLTGAIGDLVRGRLRGAANPGDADRAALHAATAGVLDGTPVNVAPMLDAARLGSAYASRLAARGASEAGTYRSFAPNGMSVDLRPEVVEADSLITSHGDDGTVNPDYPAELQPRDRTSAASQAQITELASRLEPERLGPSPEAATGAPIVGPDNVVESGNGRTLALRRVHATPELADQAAAYRAYLQALGFDTEGMKAPVLIGRRVSELNPDERVSFARAGNTAPVAALNTTERALNDADRAGAAVDQWQPGPVGGEANKGFVAAFMAQMPAEERGGLMLADGRLSAEGERRIRAALLAHAYGDELGPTLERLLNGDVEHMRGVAGALTDVAGRWGQMRAAAARGEIPAPLDITPALGEAVRLLDAARRTGRTLSEVLAQGDALNPPSAAAVGLLRLMFADDAMRRPIARARLAELLNGYAEEALKAHPGPDMFGAAEVGPGDVLRTVAGSSTAADAAVEALAEHADRVRAAEAAGGDDAPTIAQAEAAAKASPEEGLPQGDATRPAEAAPVLSEEAAGARPEDIINPLDRTASPQEKVDQLRALTAENRPVVADLMRRVDEALGTHSSDNEKAPENILSKASRPSIRARKPWHDVEHIRDSYRFKTVVNRLEDVGDALKIALDAGVKLVKVDTEKLFQPGEWGWRIASFDLRMPNGQLVEWYMPIRELEAAKKGGGHEIFEQWRNKTFEELQAAGTEYLDALAASKKLYSDAFTAAFRRMGYASEDAARAAYDSSIARALGTDRKLSYTSWGIGKSDRETLLSGSQAPEAVRTMPLAGPDEISTRPVSGSSSTTGVSGSRDASMATSSEDIGRPALQINDKAAPPEPDLAAARQAGLVTEAEAAELDKAQVDSTAQQSALEAAATCVARGLA